MDTKKYIIEIPDNTAWIQWVKVSDKDGHVCFDFKDPEDLIPYIEPDIKAVNRDEVDKIYDEARERGYKEGQARGYQEGLSDAWDAARKIVLSREDGGLFEYEARKSVFGCGNYMALKNYSASEAIEKIRQYEQEQKEIKVGDEVIGIYSSGEQTMPFVITKGNSDYYFGIYSHSGEFCQGGLKLQKTGRHFPEIAKVLRKMQEG